MTFPRSVLPQCPKPRAGGSVAWAVTWEVVSSTPAGPTLRVFK